MVAISPTTLTSALAMACVALTLGAIPAQAADTEVAFVEKAPPKSLLQDLRKGGYVLYMRHGNTDNSRADRAPSVDINDCATQRVLNEEGRQVAAAVGKSIAKARLPIGDIFHSPMCRARESAQLAFPTQHKKLKENLSLAYTANLTTEQKVPVLAATRKLVSEPVAKGSNRVIVAHAPNMADLMGYFVKPEGTVVVLRPLGDGQFDYLASIHPDDWATLLK